MYIYLFPFVLNYFQNCILVLPTIYLQFIWNRYVNLSAFKIFKLWSVIQKHNFSFKFWSLPSALMLQKNHPPWLGPLQAYNHNTFFFVIKGNIIAIIYYSTYLKWRVSIIIICICFFAFCFWLGDEGCNNNVDEDKIDICQNMYHLNYIIIGRVHVTNDYPFTVSPLASLLSSTIWGQHIMISMNDIN